MEQMIKSQVDNQTQELKEGGHAVKKVVVFIGTHRKKHTYEAVMEFKQRLEELGGVETEVIALSDYHIKQCTGCKTCFLKGEEFCPLKDDRDLLIGKLMESDGVVFATPNYSFMCSALMKTFLERLGFIFHRPRFFRKTFTSIVNQGIFGGGKIVRYLDFVGKGLGFDVVKGSCVTALEPMTGKEKQKRDEILAAHAKRFHEGLWLSPDYLPSLLEVVLFRMARTSIRLNLNDSYRDYRYYSDMGWFNSEFYFPTRLGPLKKIAGWITDALQNRMSRKRGA